MEFKNKIRQTWNSLLTSRFLHKMLVQGLLCHQKSLYSTIHAGRQGLTQNTEGPVHSDTDSTAVGDPELVPNPPGDALQESCSTADPQRSNARSEEQPSSSGISAEPDGMAFSGQRCK